MEEINSPFSESDCQYCVRSTSSDRPTELYATLEEACATLESIPLGYKNLWVMRRVSLSPPNLETILYPDEQNEQKQESWIGRYFIYCSSGVLESSSQGFSSRERALDYLEPRRKPNVGYIVACLLQDHYWH